MSERFNTITVVLEDDVSEEHIDVITSAISMIRGVLSAKANQVDIESDYIAELRVKSVLRRKLFEVLRD